MYQIFPRVLRGRWQDRSGSLTNDSHGRKGHSSMWLPSLAQIALKAPSDDACITNAMSVSEGLLTVRRDHSGEEKWPFILEGGRNEL